MTDIISAVTVVSFHFLQICIKNGWRRLLWSEMTDHSLHCSYHPPTALTVIQVCTESFPYMCITFPIIHLALFHRCSVFVTHGTDLHPSLSLLVSLPEELLHDSLRPLPIHSQGFRGIAQVSTMHHVPQHLHRQSHVTLYFGCTTKGVGHSQHAHPTHYICSHTANLLFREAPEWSGTLQEYYRHSVSPSSSHSSGIMLLLVNLIMKYMKYIGCSIVYNWGFSRF